jgi:hypothetical protein
MGFYDDLANRRNDDATLRATILETVARLREGQTDVDHPGMLLGKIQSGKTRAFLGVIAACFDEGYRGVIVLTKGTVTLAIQTLARIEEAFGDLRERDECQMFDVLAMPPRLSLFERNQRIILVAKKEDDNLRALLQLITEDYPDWRDRRWLIIDDEADFASTTFRRNGTVVTPGTINGQIEDLRGALATSQFLEVTATPYSLYLQPEEGMVVNGIPIMRPRRPHFTIILPTHDAYVGGEYYFERSLDETSPASRFYEEVPAGERDILKAPDRRSFKIEDALTSPKIAVLRRGLMNFIVGVTVRRLQQGIANETLQKYSFVVHTERGRDSHEWQLEVVDALWQGFAASIDDGSNLLETLIEESYLDIAPSVELTGAAIPALDEVRADVMRALRDGELTAEKINSDSDVLALLDRSGQLRLRTPMNLFIGGQILDRGITIHNLIGFYYGRNPQRSQQDTVLQHSRMYGARATADLGVTRLYAPRAVYNRMRQIHELDAALRDAFIRGDYDQGVYFVERDDRGLVIPCAPNKLLISDVYALRPGHRMTPTGFTTVAEVRGQGRLRDLDDLVTRLVPEPQATPTPISVADAERLLELALSNLEFDDDVEGHGYKAAMTTSLRWLANQSGEARPVFVVVARDREVSRLRGARLSNSPTTKQQHDFAAESARTSPILYLMRQSGDAARGWRGLPFWWPVVQVPDRAAPALYAVN